MKSFKDFISDQQQKYKIFIDMDGVLTDFEGRFEELYGKKIGNDITKKESYSYINRSGISFWSEMNWIPEAKRLIKRIGRHNFYILSAPLDDEESKKGKKIWVKKNLMIPESRIILEKQKEKYVENEFSILIDDKKENINKWKDKGGIGIHHTSVRDTLREIRKLGL